MAAKSKVLSAKPNVCVARSTVVAVKARILVAGSKVLAAKGNERSRDPKQKALAAKKSLDPKPENFTLNQCQKSNSQTALCRRQVSQNSSSNALCRPHRDTPRFRRKAGAVLKARFSRSDASSWIPLSRFFWVSFGVSALHSSSLRVPP